MTTHTPLADRRHLAAFMGNCGLSTCSVCHPARPAVPVIVQSPFTRRALARELPVKEVTR